MRERDRLGNKYPRLHYPELYVLKGGYKDFFLKCRVRPNRLFPWLASICVCDPCHVLWLFGPEQGNVIPSGGIAAEELRSAL